MTNDETSPALLCEADSIPQAYAIAAALREVGIEPIVVTEDSVRIDAISTTSRSAGVPVLVPAADLETARERLEAFRTAAREVDWAAEDVGERADEVPLRKVGRMPLIVRVAFIVAVAVLVVGLVAGVVSLVM